MRTENDFKIEVPLNGVMKKTAPIFQKKEKVKVKKRAPGEVSGTRRELDAYDTPPELALACVKWCREHLGGIPETPLVLDPTAGGGPFAAAARQVWEKSRVVAVDIRDVCKSSCEAAGATFACADALTLNPATIKRADLIVTNPPFKLADELVKWMWINMKEGASLAFLLSVTFLGSEERWHLGSDTIVEDHALDAPGLFKRAPLAYCVPIVPRPSFIGSTSPKFEAALFVWVKGKEEPEGYVPWETRIPDDPIRWVKTKKARGEK
jgi:hypothetical protein